jgi:NADPH2 dehydrogenase
MARLASTYRLKGLHVRNRFVFPPVVCFGFASDDGTVTDRHYQHYAERSEEGAGIIITEATSIRKDGRAAPSQLGI